MEQQERAKKLPVRRTDTSLIRDEFDSLRAKFDAEMRQMEQDMARFRDQMMQSSFAKQKHFSSTNESRSTSVISKSTSKTTSSEAPVAARPAEQQLQPNEAEAGTKQDDDWLSGFTNSPMVVNSGDGHERLLKLRFDVSAYEPDKIVVMTFDERLKVCAKREQTSEHKSIVSEYNREFLLPTGVDLDQIKSTLSADGILTVEVPLSGSR